MFPLEIWDNILESSDIDALLRLSAVNSYFLAHCESHLQLAVRKQYPWAQKSLIGEPNGDAGSWRLSALRLVQLRGQRPDFTTPSGSRIECREVPLRRFPQFDAQEHTHRPLFYDETHTVVNGVPLVDIQQFKTLSNTAVFPPGDRGLLDAEDTRPLWTSTSEPTETDDYYFQAYSDVRGYYMKVYLETISKNTLESTMHSVPIREDTEPPIDAVSSHNDRVFVTVSQRRTFSIFYFDPTASKFHLVLQTTGQFSLFTQNKVMADLNIIRLLSHDGYFINFELIPGSPEPRRVMGCTKDVPKWSHFCVLSHPQSHLQSNRYVAWFKENNDFDISKHRQSLMCVVADLKEYRVWRVPMHCLLLVVGLYNNSMACWLIDKDPLPLICANDENRKNLLKKATARWRTDPSEVWEIK